MAHIYSCFTYILMVIFHSYVSLPEGSYHTSYVFNEPQKSTSNGKSLRLAALAHDQILAKCHNSQTLIRQNHWDHD